ncbi:DNA cytosine methyltransferase [Hellea sp.]|nr:DNA cytosine methyltransferase [Hellea sp.]
MSIITYIDLFAGAGGLSEGFLSAGFTPVAHVEADKAATFTLKTRAAYHYLKDQNKIGEYHKYLKGKISRSELYDIIPDDILETVVHAKIGEDNKRIFKNIDSLLGERSVDIIVGGPPCQAYSLVGRAPLKHKKTDERRSLYIEYGRFLKKYNPKAFVFENVPGMLTAGGGVFFKNLQKYFKRIGYVLEPKILNAKDFGVIQNRRRIIIVGWRKGEVFEFPELDCQSKEASRDEIFSDLKKIKPGHSKRISKYSQPCNQYLEESGIRNCVDFVSQHVTRPHNDRDLRIYKLAIKKMNKGDRIKNNQIPENMRTQKNTTDFLDRFKVVDKMPHTMIAHIAKDGHHFIHPDVTQCRSISVREAARIQSFPDDYYFEGVRENVFRSPAFRQIGNAVPPLMAKEIAIKIKDSFS